LLAEGLAVAIADVELSNGFEPVNKSETASNWLERYFFTRGSARSLTSFNDMTIVIFRTLFSRLISPSNCNLKSTKRTVCGTKTHCFIGSGLAVLISHGGEGSRAVPEYGVGSIACFGGSFNSTLRRVGNSNCTEAIFDPNGGKCSSGGT
ncbi:hypothetical protein T10_12605, partial [Trichinella papuae]